MPNKLKLIQVSHNLYKGEGYTMGRENGISPNGNPFQVEWVLRSPEGKFIDRDAYRHDLADRHEIILENNGYPKDWKSRSEEQESGKS